MTKNLLLLLFAFFPFTTVAQTEVASFKDFCKDVKELTTTLKVDDKTNIIEVNKDNEHFDLIAIDSKMNVLWKTTLDGYSLSLANFKGKILAVAATDFGFVKGKSNTYKGYLLDPSTGKVSLEKIIYDNSQDYAEAPYFFQTQDGSFFKLAVRQTSFKRKLHVGMPGMLALFTLNKLENDADETREITVIDFDEQLQPVNTFQPAVSDDTFITMACNYSGSLFIAWYRKDGNVNVLEYPEGKKTATAQIAQKLDMHSGRKKRDAAHNFEFYASVENQNIVYYSLLYNNLENDPELTVSKLDFSKNTKQAVTELFTRSRLKEIQKAYEPVNKKLSKPDDILVKELEVRFIREENDRLLVGMSSRVFNTSSMGTPSFTEGSLLLNGYDLNLTPKYQQIFPTDYTNNILYLATDYQKHGDALNFIGNFKTKGALYGTMDIATGQWKSMELIPKNKLSSYDYIQSGDILWYPDGFIIPYLNIRGMMRMNRDIALQQMTY